MNRGLNGFPSRDSLFSVGTGAAAGQVSGDPYAPPDGVAYMVPSDDVMRGDLLGASPARNCFPLRAGSLPSGGAAGSALAPAADVMAATSVLSVSGSAMTTGGVAVAYASAAVAVGTPATVSAADLPLHDACLLASGDYVVGYGLAPTFQRFNAAGASQSSSDGSTTAVPADIAVCALADGGFVGAWCSTSTPTIRFRRYNSAGVLQGSETIVEAITSNRCSVAGLTGGSFVVAYVTAGALKFGIYDAGGTLVGSLASVASGISTNAKSSVSVVALSGGGFVIVYASTVASGSYWFGRYDASGVLQGALTQATTTSTVGWVDAAATNSGGFALAYSNETNLVSAMIYDAAGVQVGSSTTISTSASLIGAMANLPSGDLVVGYVVGANMRYAKTNSAGTIVSTSLDVEAGGTIQSSKDVSVAALADDRFALFYNDSTPRLRQCQTTYSGSATFSRFSKDGVRVGLLTDLSAEASRNVSVAGLDGGGVAFAWTTRTGIPQVAVATSTGIVGAASAPETVYSRSVSVAAIAGGGFVVAYEDYHGALVRVRRYTAAGVAVAAAATVEATTSSSLSVAGLDTGGYVVGYLNASGHARFATFTSGGAAALAPATAYASPLGYVSAAGASAGRFALHFATASTAFVALMTAAGVVTLRNLQASSGGSFVAGGIAAIPGDMYAVTFSETGGANGVRTARLSIDNELMLAPLTVGAVSSPTSSQATTSGGDTWSLYVDGSNITIGRYASSVVILGTALTSASPNGLVPVRVSGIGTLRQDWGPPQTFDHTDATPIQGNNGSVVGRAAILKGF